MFSKCLGTVATSKVGDVDYHRHASLLSGAASIESVMYNPTVNQFERLLELGEGGKPAKLKFSISKVDMTQVVDNMEEVPLITEGETNSVFFSTFLDQMSASILGARTKMRIRKKKSKSFLTATYSGENNKTKNILVTVFFGTHLSLTCSPEAASNDQSLTESGDNILEMSDSDSETEPSLSQELDSNQKGLTAESLWSGHVVQANKSLAVVLTVEQPLVVNVTDGLLSSLQDLVEGEELSEAEPELINNLGGEGSVVYTEIKVS